MYNLVRKTLEIYLKEKRIITQTEFPQDLIVHLNSQNAVFVTLYLDEKVIASSGRIQCKNKIHSMNVLIIRFFVSKILDSMLKFKM